MVGSGKLSTHFMRRLKNCMSIDNNVSWIDWKTTLKTCHIYCTPGEKSSFAAWEDKINSTCFQGSWEASELNASLGGKSGW